MIATLEALCWVVSESDSDPGFHYERERDAVGHAAALLAMVPLALPAGTWPPVPAATLRMSPCWIADCDQPGCDAFLGNREDDIYTHAPSAVTLTRWGRRGGWTFTPGGLAWCPGHPRAMPVPARPCVPERQVTW